MSTVSLLPAHLIAQFCRIEQLFMSTMSATVHGFGVSDAYIVKYGRKYLCAKWLAFTLHDRVFALAAAL